MTSISAKVTGTQITLQVNGPLTCGMVGLPIEFAFDETWDGLKKTAVFRSSGLTKDRLNIEKYADQMIAKCKEVSTDFSKIQPGEVVWMSGHIGVYVGDGLAVEATHRWKDGVQRTAVHNIGTIPGYNGRKWTKHGKLPWINYEDVPKLDTTSTGAVKVDPAAKYTRSYVGTYQVKSAIGLKLRTGASTSKKILETMPNGSTVKCYGYHTGSWLFVVSESGKQGFCHKSLLKKV